MSNHLNATVTLIGNAGRSRQPTLSPEQLIERFCTPAAVGDLAGTSTETGALLDRGWCGYDGGAGCSLAVGFDDGYDFLDCLTECGWKPIPEIGEWPYSVYVLYPSREQSAVAHYCEADLFVRRFESTEACARFIGGLR